MPDLNLLNPWWKGREYIKQDKHILDLKEKKYKWKPGLIEGLKLVPNNIFTLRGPRQIGKTTLVKLLINGLLDRGMNEKAIFFWNCDELFDFRELSSILREYIEFSKVNNIKKKYIFLDEVSRIKDWQRAVKGLHDSGELSDCCLMLTGSHTLDIKYGIERLPGRTGKLGKDLMLLPITFSEYVALIKPEIASKFKKIKRLSIEEINKNIGSVEVFDSELKVLFKQYLITGGFPLVVNEFFSNKKIPDYVYDLYSKWVIGDIVKWGKQEKILIQLLKSIILKQSTPISWDSISKESEIKSHKTVSAYVEDLENMFVLLVLYFLDMHKNTPNFDKNKKLYIFDPFIFHAFNKRIYFKENEITPALIEATIASNLARLTYMDLFPQIYYWKNKKEVDVLLKIKNNVFPLEIKYQSRISKQDYLGLHYFKEGILITKDVLAKDKKYPAIPAHMLLAIL